MTDIPGNLFPRKMDKRLPIALNAAGMFIKDESGREFLDASGGAVVVNAGHGREKIARAVYDQILSHDYIHPTMFTTRPAETLAEKLAARAPGDINRFYFLSGGSEANEAAIKLARQIHVESGNETKYRTIGRQQSYHGLTLGSLAVMDRVGFKHIYKPLLKDTIHIPAPYCYRCSFDLEYPSCNIRCAAVLDDRIKEAGEETISAFLAETVPGATIACSQPPDEYWGIIRQICDHRNVLLILDEVMCGMGRTGSWFAYEHFDVTPDIVTLGKGLAGGVLPLSAMGVKEKHFNLIKDNSGSFVHGGTFTHHPVCTAAGLALVDIFGQEELVQRVKEKGSILGSMLKKNLLDLPCVGNIRGKGFLWGIEIVKDKITKAPFKRSLKVVERLWENIFEKGVLVYPAGGLAGEDGDGIIVSPPYIITDDEMDMVVETLTSSFREFFKS